MQEDLKWRKRPANKSELIGNLQSLLHGAVMSEINNINSKIESLCRMGVIEDGPKMQELREKIKHLQIQTGTNNEFTDNRS